MKQQQIAVSVCLLLLLSVGGWAAPAPKVLLNLHGDFLLVSAPDSVSVQFQVFALSGRRIFNSGILRGAAYKWYFDRSDRKSISNGVYLYVVTTRVGQKIYTAMGKIAVRR